MAPYRIYPVSAEGSYGVATFIITGGQLRSYGVANFNHIRWPIWIGIRNIHQETKGRLKTFGGAAVGGHRKEDDHSLSIEKVLKRSSEIGTIEARKQRIERLKVTEWKIWKLLGIEWE
jgi:hypothetical protein